MIELGYHACFVGPAAKDTVLASIEAETLEAAVIGAEKEAHRIAPDATGITLFWNGRFLLRFNRSEGSNAQKA